MKVNHDLIRKTLQIAGIMLFLISVFFKLRDLLLYGGKLKTDEKGKPEVEKDDEAVEVTDEPKAEAGSSMPMPTQAATCGGG